MFELIYSKVNIDAGASMMQEKLVLENVSQSWFRGQKQTVFMFCLFHLEQDSAESRFLLHYCQQDVGVLQCKPKGIFYAKTAPEN